MSYLPPASSVVPPAPTAPDIGPAMYESSPDCVKVLDNGGNLLSMNRNGRCAMEIDDFSPLVGLPWASLWPAEMAATVLTALAAARSGGSGRFEAFCATAKGTPKWWEVIVAPILGADGRTERILAISRDVSGARQAGEALQHSAERLELATEAADLGLWTWDPVSDQVTWDNQRTYDILGVAPSAQPVNAARFAADFLHPDDVERFGQAVAASVAGDVRFQFEGRMRDKNGALRWIELYGRPQDSDAQPRTTLVGTIADITARKLAEDKLRDADRRKDEFLAMLAHELRNPLAPIGAAAELLKLGKFDEARVRKTSEIISRQVSHMTHLVNDLLDVSRVTGGVVKLDTAPLDLRDIVADAVEQSGPLIRGRGHKLCIHLPPDAGTVLGDAKRLVQIVGNLLNNAAKYTPDGGKIDLRIAIDDERVTLSVADNGIGMEHQLACRVFDLFSQAEHTSDRTAGGLGLGLALVKSLVEMHGGSVSCASGGTGAGSTFSVSLPRLRDGREAPLAVHAPERLAGQARTLDILVVDDNVDAAAMLAMLLEASGHRMTVEHSARDALARIETARFDVCLLDIGLPEMDGNALAARLRSHPHTRNALLVAITGYGQESDRQRSQAAGFDQHMVKPVDTGRLMDVLAEVA
ncbi:PAS domain-containing protein [Massilia violaceinigra]|uniref:histidine kinase n=1 Tax=Massilia violaceinigra TaxID=2045208 RepID=A0ABY4A427_9BURK|nr:ATP-binding protein [Massilia violaceinigra]UOD29525.1 PAS domain-containing protein [Massilia violaceinigra]